jgi:hypothetical protein
MTGNRFVKGRTNNHLTWAMVDATDFATPESALSAAMTIKIYGKVRGGTGVNFVSSGTGSLTNDIQHVGASALGLYTIALAKADLSDASAAWYDQYIVALSATGAARQVLIVDGGIDASALSAYQSRLSDLASYLVAMSGMLSDTHSAAILAASNASEAQSHATLAASRVLVVQSRLSDFDSRLVSDLSDVLSAVNVGNSRALLNQSRISDVQSYLVAMSDSLSDAHSDLASKIGAVTATVSASDMSDIASRVDVLLTSRLSDILSAAQQTNSRVLVVQSMVSDVQSVVSNINSLAASSPTASDIASAVLVEFGGDMSDIRSALAAGVALDASTMSDLRSAITAVTATVSASDMSDIASRVRVLFDSDLSDILSRLTVVQSMASDAHSAAAQGNSRVLVVQSMVSDLQSKLSDVESNLLSVLGTTGVQLNASTMSDLRSAITAGATGLDASALSDIASAVVAAIGAAGVELGASSMSDLRSMVSDVKSAVTVTQSMASDIYSLLSDLHSDVTDLSGVVSDFVSDFGSRVPKLVATNSQIAAGVPIGASDMSDIRSAITANGVLKAGVEPTVVIGHADTLAAKVDWLTAISRNKITQTATVQSIRNDADNADIASAAVSDDGTTFTRAEFGN